MAYINHFGAVLVLLILLKVLHKPNSSLVIGYWGNSHIVPMEMLVLIQKSLPNN